MKLLLFLLIVNIIVISSVFSQTGMSINVTGTPADNSAILDMSSTAQGILISRMTTAQRDAIASPALSLLIFNTTTNCFEAYVNGSWYSISCTSPPICSQFQKTYGGYAQEEAISVQQTKDGGYMIGGNSNTWGAGGNDIYFVKTDDKGDLSWSKTIGGTGNDYTYSIQQTKDGGYILGATTSSFGAGGYDFYLVRTDGSGNTLWHKTFGGAGNEYTYLVQQTGDGGFIMVGYTNSFGAGSYDMYLVKTDESGNLSWSRTYGGTGEDWAFSVRQTRDGGYIIAGTTYSFGAGINDVYLVRTDESGKLLWSNTFGGTGREVGRSVQQTTDGGYVICATTMSFGITGLQVYLIKTDESGNLSWNKTYGGNVGDIAFNVQQTRDAGYMMAGYTQSFSPDRKYDYFLVKADVSGNLLWSKCYGGLSNDYGYFGQQTSDGGYIFAGITDSFGTGNRDLYLVKTDENGNAGECNTTIPPTTFTTPVPTITSPATISSTPSTIAKIPNPTVTTLTSTVHIQCSLCK